MTIVFSSRAKSDITAHWEYVSSFSLDAADRVKSKLLQQLNVLSSYPDLGRVGRVDGTRELVISRTDLIAVYEVRQEIVRILRIVHGAQDWPARF